MKSARRLVPLRREAETTFVSSHRRIAKRKRDDNCIYDTDDGKLHFYINLPIPVVILKIYCVFKLHWAINNLYMYIIN